MKDSGLVFSFQITNTALYMMQRKEEIAFLSLIQLPSVRSVKLLSVDPKLSYNLNSVVYTVD